MRFNGAETDGVFGGHKLVSRLDTVATVKTAEILAQNENYFCMFI